MEKCCVLRAPFHLLLITALWHLHRESARETREKDLICNSANWQRTMVRETQIPYLCLISPWLFPGCHSQSSCYPQNCWRSYSGLCCFSSTPSSAGWGADGPTLWWEQHTKSPHTPGQVTQSFPLLHVHNSLNINRWFVVCFFFFKSLDRCNNFSWVFSSCFALWAKVNSLHETLQAFHQLTLYKDFPLIAVAFIPWDTQLLSCHHRAYLA